MNWRLAAMIAATDLRRRLRDRSLIATGIIGPFALALIISLSFGGGGIDVSIGIQDLDGSPTSSLLVDGLTKGPSETDQDHEAVEIVEIDPSRAAEAAVAADEGPTSVIVVPDGFADSLAGPQPLALELVVDDGDEFTAEIAQAIAEGIAARVDRTRLLVTSATLASEGGTEPLDGRLVALAAAAPDTIMLTQAETDGSYSAASYFAPAMTMFFLFFTLGTGASGLIVDRRSGVLGRMRATPVGDATIIVGRAGGVAALGLLSALTLWVVSGPAMGAEWGPPLQALTLIVCVVLAISGLSMLVMSLARTQSQVTGATSIVGFGMALVGGTFIPTTGLPDVLRSLALFTPNGLAQRGFTELSLGTATLAGIWWVPVGLLAMALVFGGTSLVFIRRRVLT